MTGYATFRDAKPRTLTPAIRAALADERPRTSADVVARVGPGYSAHIINSRMHEMVARGELLKELRPRPGTQRMVAWFRLNRHWSPATPVTASSLVMTCAEPTLQDRLRAYLEDARRATVKSAAAALALNYDSVKTGMQRMHARGLADRVRDPDNGNIVWYMWKPAPVAPVRPVAVLPDLRHLPDEDDRHWTPKPWVNPIRARALGLKAA